MWLKINADTVFLVPENASGTGISWKKYRHFLNIGIWQIEVFFKTCKSYLQLLSECHSLSYDALTAHVAIVFTRYLMIAMEQRRNEDDRTLGEIIFFFTDELTDITFGESFQIIITAMIDSVCAIFQPTEEQLALFIEMFVGKLPDYIRNSLTKAAMASWSAYLIACIIEF